MVSSFRVIKALYMIMASTIVADEFTFSPDNCDVKTETVTSDENTSIQSTPATSENSLSSGASESVTLFIEPGNDQADVAALNKILSKVKVSLLAVPQGKTLATGRTQSDGKILLCQSPGLNLQMPDHPVSVLNPPAAQKTTSQPASVLDTHTAQKTVNHQVSVLDPPTTQKKTYNYPQPVSLLYRPRPQNTTSQPRPVSLLNHFTAQNTISQPRPVSLLNRPSTQTTTHQPRPVSLLNHPSTQTTTHQPRPVSLFKNCPSTQTTINSPVSLSNGTAVQNTVSSTKLTRTPNILKRTKNLEASATGTASKTSTTTDVVMKSDSLKRKPTETISELDIDMEMSLIDHIKQRKRTPKIPKDHGNIPVVNKEKKKPDWCYTYSEADFLASGIGLSDDNFSELGVVPQLRGHALKEYLGPHHIGNNLNVDFILKKMYLYFEHERKSKRETKYLMRPLRRLANATGLREGLLKRRLKYRESQLVHDIVEEIHKDKKITPEPIEKTPPVIQKAKGKPHDAFLLKVIKEKRNFKLSITVKELRKLMLDTGVIQEPYSHRAVRMDIRRLGYRFCGCGALKKFIHLPTEKKKK